MGGTIGTSADAFPTEHAGDLTGTCGLLSAITNNQEVKQEWGIHGAGPEIRPA